MIYCYEQFTTKKEFNKEILIMLSFIPSPPLYES